MGQEWQGRLALHSQEQISWTENLIRMFLHQLKLGLRPLTQLLFFQIWEVSSLQTITLGSEMPLFQMNNRTETWQTKPVKLHSWTYLLIHLSAVGQHTKEQFRIWLERRRTRSLNQNLNWKIQLWVLGKELQGLESKKTITCPMGTQKKVTFYWILKWQMKTLNRDFHDLL